MSRLSANQRNTPRGLVLAFADFVLAPLFGVAASLLYLARKYTFKDVPRIGRAIVRAGVYPLIDHYYEPLIDFKRLKRPLSAVRELPGISWDNDAYVAWLESAKETRALVPAIRAGRVPAAFSLDNETFGAGDAEVLFGLVRMLRPRRIIEIGCGNSSLVIQAALALNREEHGAPAEHVCVEPYEVPWLGQTGATVHRARVEECAPELFRSLRSGDILFIDSSHIIRPQGDVLFLIQEVLGRLAPGVIIHFHDIFSPRDYSHRLFEDHHIFWNEQYLLEAFLAFNRDFEILLPLNHLWHERRAAMLRACPGLEAVSNEPASFWIRRRTDGP